MGFLVATMQGEKQVKICNWDRPMLEQWIFDNVKTTTVPIELDAYDTGKKIYVLDRENIVNLWRYISNNMADYKSEDPYPEVRRDRMYMSIALYLQHTFHYEIRYYQAFNFPIRDID